MASTLEIYHKTLVAIAESGNELARQALNLADQPSPNKNKMQQLTSGIESNLQQALKSNHSRCSNGTDQYIEYARKYLSELIWEINK
jgi:hypothetical protein